MFFGEEYLDEHLKTHERQSVKPCPEQVFLSKLSSASAWSEWIWVDCFLGLSIAGA